MAQQLLRIRWRHIGNERYDLTKPSAENTPRFCFNGDIVCRGVLNVTSIEINLLTLAIIMICTLTRPLC